MTLGLQAQKKTREEKSKHSRGILLLIITTVLWGTSFPLLKQVVGDVSPAVILAVRSTIAAAVFVPWLRKLDATLLRDGAFLGVLYFAECATALLGLETISANRSAFIISFNVILVPIFSVCFGKKLSLQVICAAGLAIAGIGILSWEGGGWSQGDWLTLGCAIGVATHILTLGVLSPRHATLPLVAVQLGVMSLLSLTWAAPQLVEQMAAVAQHSHTLLYIGLAVTATPIWTQTIAQRYVAAHETAFIYTLEPVFAAIFSFGLLGEQLGIRGMIGAALVLIATFWSQQKSEVSKSPEGEAR
ncbi:MAG: DMT family transporter [Drouetiella hepatica Uher 2000/2452]|jgi:drug/metabolite transporter (DMT)-like permease|uniref:DMT family transporter n=1 Tax=Drouetiella hepatica Uher 2000/2452 TaxID=904376 RepID=A0A951QH97_9CYAN|nr:DMT family transporter [Drouetiella hepatica Uher 2000/2452]